MKIKVKKLGYFFLGLIASFFNGGGKFTQLSNYVKGSKNLYYEDRS